jgi:cell shape-determining protein MreC
MPKDYANQELKPPRQRLFRKLKFVFGFTIFKLLIVLAIGIFSYFTYKTDYRLIVWLAPVEKICQYAIFTCSSSIEKIRGYVADRNALIRENAEARQKLLQYEREFFNYERLKSENAYLRAILPIVNEQNLETLTVVPRINPRTPFLVLFYASPSTYDKIKVGNVVISPQGMVGRVVSKQKKRTSGEVSVLLATHIQSRIPVISAESRQRAMLHGQNSSVMAIKHVQPSYDDDAIEGKPFIGGGDVAFKEGEILMLLCDGAEIPVAKVVTQHGKMRAKWIVDSHMDYMTVVVSVNVLNE